MNFIKGLEIPCIKFNDLEAFFLAINAVISAQALQTKNKKINQFYKNIRTLYQT